MIPAAIKLVFNCLIVAAATLAGLSAFVSLPAFTLEPLQWVGRHFERPVTTAFWHVYTFLLWVPIAALIAWCMLILRPRNVVLYGLASVTTFIIVGQSWSLGNAYGQLRELVLALAIPTLYWLLVRLVGKRHNGSLNRGAGSAGSG